MTDARPTETHVPPAGGDAPAAADQRWYAVWVHGRQEKAAAADLAHRAVEVFLPLRRERRRWSDRWQTVETALFPGYLFVHTGLGADRRLEILKARRVGGIVGAAGQGRTAAAPIPDHEIESVRLLLQSQRDLDPVDRLTPGVAVSVVAGPLSGARGVVERAPDGRRRLVVQVSLLGRGVRTVLDADDVLAEEQTGPAPTE